MEHICLQNRGIVGGILISIAACAYVTCDNPIIGACFFAFGLIAICAVQAKLYTGVVGYAFTNPNKYSTFSILEILFGNILGVFFVSLCVNFSKLNGLIGDKIDAIAEAKLNDNLLSVFLLSVLCGICVYIGVEAYAKRTPLSAIGLFLSVAVFIICGFEHSIADAFYLTCSKKIFTAHGAILFAIALFGNSFGAIFANGCLEE